MKGMKESKQNNCFVYLLPFSSMKENDIQAAMHGAQILVGESIRVSSSFQMCSSPDALHLRQLKQFAAVIAAASVLGKKIRGKWENCQKIRAKQMPQISKGGGFHNPKPHEFSFHTQQHFKVYAALDDLCALSMERGGHQRSE